MDKQRRGVDEPSAEAFHRLASAASARASRQTVQSDKCADVGFALCIVRPRQLHTDRAVQQIQPPTHKLAIEDTGGLHFSHYNITLVSVSM